MAWQDVFPVSNPRIDAEEDREQRLAAQARAGADWALTALVARYQPPVTRYLTRLTGNADLARALAARVFIRMERRLHGPEAGRNLRLWLLRASTEAGLDALRKPQHVRATLLAAPKRPVGLLTDGAPGTPVQRLRARVDALAQAALQTRRQVRKLVWAAMPDPAATADLDADFDADPDADAAHDARDPELVEALRRQDPREALRYRIVRAVLAELPYGDAQCLALHLVAGLNQAEVATALGLTNSAARRRIVQGLQLFSQRFNAAAASLGLAPDALARHPTHPSPLEPGVGGYVPVQEQPTVTISSPYAAAAGLAAASANGHAPTPAPAPLDAATVVEAAPPSAAAGPSAGELPPDAGVIPAGAVVDAAPADVDTHPATDGAPPADDAIVVDALPAADDADEAVSADADIEAAPFDAATLDAATLAETEPPAIVDAEPPADEAMAADVPVGEPDELADLTGDAAEDPADAADVAEAPEAGETLEAGETPETIPAAYASVDVGAHAADASVAVGASVADAAEVEAGTIPAEPGVIEPRVVPVLTPRAEAAPVSVPVRLVPVLTRVTPAAEPANDEVGDPAGLAGRTEQGDD